MDQTLYQVAAQAQDQPGPSPVQPLYALATSPGQPRQLARHMRWGLALVAALLMASGLIFWIAANWQEQSRMFKLGLIESALALSLIAALCSPRARLAGLLCAHLVLGGLLAFVGQTYQTGADAWQLFAAWAALSLIWTLIARSDVLWVLWVLVAATGLVTWAGKLGLEAMLSSALDNRWNAVLWLALALVPWLVSRCAWLRLPQGMGWWSHRLALGLALSAWTAMGLRELMEHEYQGIGFFLLMGVLVAATLFISLKGPVQDFASLCMAALAANVLLLAALLRMIADIGWEGLFMLMSLGTLACLWATVVGLTSVQRSWREQADSQIDSQMQGELSTAAASNFEESKQ